MSAFARWLSRITWWWMLWFIRRPSIKRIQQALPKLVSDERRRRFIARQNSQNRFARRHGLRILYLSFCLMLASLTFSAAVMITIRLYDAGLLTLPRTIRQRMSAQRGVPHFRSSAF